jgi:hypothetical protein
MFAEKLTVMLMESADLALHKINPNARAPSHVLIVFLSLIATKLNVLLVTTESQLVFTNKLTATMEKFALKTIAIPKQESAFIMQSNPANVNIALPIQTALNGQSPKIFPPNVNKHTVLTISANLKALINPNAQFFLSAMTVPQVLVKLLLAHLILMVNHNAIVLQNLVMMATSALLTNVILSPETALILSSNLVNANLAKPQPTVLNGESIINSMQTAKSQVATLKDIVKLNLLVTLQNARLFLLAQRMLTATLMQPPTILVLNVSLHTVQVVYANLVQLMI